MAESIISIPVKDLKPGDKTEWYTVLQVLVKGQQVSAEVLFPDGGTGTRVWDYPNVYVVVTRKS